MNHLTATNGVIFVLASVELFRLYFWMFKKLAGWLDHRYAAHRQRVGAAAQRRRSEHSELVDIGNVAKFGLLRQAGIIPDDETRPWGDAS